MSAARSAGLDSWLVTGANDMVPRVLGHLLGADGEIRTLTDDDLNVVPLPIGLRRPGTGARSRPKLAVRSQGDRRGFPGGARGYQPARPGDYPPVHGPAPRPD